MKPFHGMTALAVEVADGHSVFLLEPNGGLNSQQHDFSMECRQMGMLFLQGDSMGGDEVSR